jgi:SSS family solute:Na+ symporter
MRMVDTLTFGAIAMVFIAATIYLGWFGYTRTKKAEDYLLAGRKVHPIILALSYGATFLSTAAIVGFGGVSGQLGMGTIWLIMLNILLGILIAFIVFGKRTRRLGKRLKALTFPDLLGKAYDSPFMQAASSLVILIGMPLYTAAVLIGGSRFIEASLGVDYDMALLGFALIVTVYVAFGGIIAVMYNDALQGAIMLIGMVILLALTYSLLGGIEVAHADLTALTSQVPGGLAAIGHQGWTFFPEFGSSLWFTFFTTIILGVGVGVLAQPQLVVRFMTADSDKVLNRAIAVGGPFVLLVTGGAYTVGALTNVYFYNEYGMLSQDYVGGNIDSIIPTYVNEAMPELFVAVFILALLAAALSTLSSLMHTMGTTAGYDLWRYMRTMAKDSRLNFKDVLHGNEGASAHAASYKASQYGTVVMIVASVIVAYYMPGSIVARATAMFMGLCASAFLPAFAYALFNERPSLKAAKASIVIGTVVWFLWTALVHIKESSVLGISEFFFDKPALLGQPWEVVDPLMLALPLSAITLFVVAHATRAEALEGIAVAE